MRAAHPSAKDALKVYAPATVLASNYPNLLNEDFASISVGAFLVTYDYNLKDTVDSFGRLGKSLCQNFARLQAEGQAKWREVSLSLPKLVPGWIYYPPTTRELRNCVVKKVKNCAAKERILGLCG